MMKAMSIIGLAYRSGAIVSIPNMPIAASAKKRTTIKNRRHKADQAEPLGIKYLAEELRLEEKSKVKLRRVRSIVANRLVSQAYEWQLQYRYSNSNSL